MITLIYYDPRSYETPDWQERDIKRILHVLHDRGYRASREDIIRAWESHSDEFAAGWLILPEDDETIYSEISKYMKAI